jgi:hypothetical protein
MPRGWVRYGRLGALVRAVICSRVTVSGCWGDASGRGARRAAGVADGGLGVALSGWVSGVRR